MIARRQRSLVVAPSIQPIELPGSPPMNKSLFGLLGAVALGVLLYLMFAGKDEPATAGEQASRASRSNDSTHEPDARALQAADDATSDSVGKQASASAAQQELSGKRVDAKGSVRIAGQLRLPANTPADERLEVRLFEEQPRASNARWSLETPEETFETVEVASDGSFSVHAPSDADSVWLDVSGRYCYLERALEIQLPRSDQVTLEPTLGVRISGRLVPPAGATEEQLQGAGEQLRLSPRRAGAFSAINSGDNAIHERRTKAEGEDLRFSFDAVPAKGLAHVRALPTHLASKRTEDFELIAGKHIALELQLGFGASLAGRALDSAGAPVAGAQIEVEQDPLVFGRGGVGVREGKTDDDGSFRLDALPPGECNLTFQADGFLDAFHTAVLAEGEQRTGIAIAFERGNSLRGRVVWPDGRPVAEAEVEVRFDASFLGGMEAMNAMNGNRADANTDSDGRFEATGLGAGPFTVTVEVEAAHQGDPEAEWIGRLDAVRPGGEDLAIELSPPVGIAGTLVDDLGAPIQEFRVVARMPTKGIVPGMGAETAEDDFEDDRGRFFLEGLRAGKWELFAMAEGYGRGEALEIQAPLENGANVELVLERGATVHGIVLDPLGNVVPLARVHLSVGLEDLAWMADEDSSSSVLSDENGRFSLTGLPSGAQELLADKEGFGTSPAYGVDLVPGEAISSVVLTLSVGGTIRGILYDDEGDPDAGETILCMETGSPTSQKFATTDSRGEFLFEHLAAGNYQVISMFAGDKQPTEGEQDNLSALVSGMKFQLVEVVDGEEKLVILGAKPENPVTVQGRVLALGKPVKGAMISFLPEEGARMENLAFASSGSDGSYQLELGGPGRYLATVQETVGTGVQQSVEFSPDIPAAAQHELDFDLPSGGISGQVRGPDKQPLDRARVSLSIDGPIANGTFTGGQYAEVLTEKDGSYELQWLRPGKYTVSAGGALMGNLLGDASDQDFGRQVRRDIQVSEGQWTRDVNFTLAEPGELIGRVVDGSGRPVADAAIFLRDEEGNSVDRISFVSSDSAGSFEYPALSEGNYQVTARTSDEVTSEAVEVRIREGQKSEVRLVLSQGTMLLVSLTDREGEPVRCKLRVTDGDGRQVNGLWSFRDLMASLSGGTISTDEQRIGPLSPGSYTLEATTEDGRDAKKSVQVDGQQERRVRLRLD